MLPSKIRSELLFVSYHTTKLVNSNVGRDTSFPVSVAFTPATLPSKETAQAAAENKQEVKSLNLNFS